MSKEVSLNLREFDMSQVGANKNLVFIGKKGTGKSSLVLDYLYHNRDIPIVTVISPTDEFNLTYKPHVPDILIHDEYSPELVEKFLKRQMNITKHYKQDPKYKNVDPRGVLILDDCLFDAKAWTGDRSIKWIFMNGRHANITMIVTLQYVMGLTTELRANADYMFICKEPKLSNRKKLYEQYCGIFPSFEMFNQVLMATTNNYGCLVIDNTSISDKLEDQVFWYKAEIHHSGFRLCYDVLWENQEKNKRSVDDSSESSEEDLDPMKRFSMQKNRLNLNVNKLNIGDF